MGLLDAEVVEAGAGTCVIEVPYRDERTQQERYFHGAVTGAIPDTAEGYAALTLAPPDQEVLTAEYTRSTSSPQREARSSWLATRWSRPGGACSSARPRYWPWSVGRAGSARPRCRRSPSRRSPSRL